MRAPICYSLDFEHWALALQRFQLGPPHGIPLSSLGHLVVQEFPCETRLISIDAYIPPLQRRIRYTVPPIILRIQQMILFRDRKGFSDLENKQWLDIDELKCCSEARSSTIHSLTVDNLKNFWGPGYGLLARGGRSCSGWIRVGSPNDCRSRQMHILYFCHKCSSRHSVRTHDSTSEGSECIAMTRYLYTEKRDTNYDSERDVYVNRMKIKSSINALFDFEEVDNHYADDPLSEELLFERNCNLLLSKDYRDMARCDQTGSQHFQPTWYAPYEHLRFPFE